MAVRVPHDELGVLAWQVEGGDKHVEYIRGDQITTVARYRHSDPVYIVGVARYGQPAGLSARLAAVQG